MERAPAEAVLLTQPLRKEVGARQAVGGSEEAKRRRQGGGEDDGRDRARGRRRGDGVGSRVASASREGPESFTRRPADASVHGLDYRARLLRLFPVAERDQVERTQRPGEASPQIAVVAGVLDDATGDERVGNL